MRKGEEKVRGRKDEIRRGRKGKEETEIGWRMENEGERKS